MNVTKTETKSLRERLVDTVINGDPSSTKQVVNRLYLFVAGAGILIYSMSKLLKFDIIQWIEDIKDRVDKAHN